MKNPGTFFLAGTIFIASSVFLFAAALHVTGMAALFTVLALVAAFAVTLSAVAQYYVFCEQNPLSEYEAADEVRWLGTTMTQLNMLYMSWVMLMVMSSASVASLLLAFPCLFVQQMFYFDGHLRYLQHWMFMGMMLHRPEPAYGEHPAKQEERLMATREEKEKLRDEQLAKSEELVAELEEFGLTETKYGVTPEDREAGNKC